MTLVGNRRQRAWAWAYGITLIGCLSLGGWALRQTPMTAPSAAAPAPLPELSREATDMQAVLDQPLFNSARKAATVSPIAGAPTTPSEVPVWIGMVIDDGQPAAMLESAAGGQRALVRIGQTFAGWKLTGIDRKSISLSAGDRRITLPLSYGTRSGAPAVNEGPSSP